MGASNVSFGLPERKLLNRTFLAMALEAGLDAPITDPLVPEYVDTIHAFEALSCKDIESKDYIRIYGGQADPVKASEKAATAKTVKEVTLEEIIIEGYDDQAAAATEKLLTVMKPLEIVETKIIPALEIVGKDYESGASFLPQLIKVCRYSESCVCGFERGDEGKRRDDVLRQSDPCHRSGRHS